MAIKRLDNQIEALEKQITEAQLDPSISNLGLVRAEFNKLKFILEGLSSFVEHRWMVKLFTTSGESVEINIRAEHLEAARDIAIELIDAFFEAIRYELYCDGILLAEHE